MVISSGELLVELPNGTFDVELTSGDASDSIGNESIVIEEYRGESISRRTGEFQKFNYTVTVNDGTFSIGPVAGNTLTLNSLRIRQISDVPQYSGVTLPLDGLHYVLMEDLDNGTVMRHSVEIPVGGGPLCPEGVFLAPNTRYRQWAL